MPTSTVMLEQDVDGPHRREPGDAVDVAGLDATRLVRRAANGDPRAWEGLIDKYGRLIWSITRDFKLVESDAADVFQTTWMRLIEHIDRIEHADRVGSWLASTARNECLRSLAARKRLVLVHEDDPFDGPAAHEPEVDEALLAAERAAGRPRGDGPAAPALAAPHGDADGRPARLLRGDLGRAGAPGGQHRPDQRSLPCPAARPARGQLRRSGARRRLPSGRRPPRFPGRRREPRPSGQGRRAPPHPGAARRVRPG